MVGLQSGNSPLKFGKGGGGVKKSCRQTTLFVWYHQGLMCPCKHLYLNALPLASIKKPRDWHV